jgi:nitrogen fixation protein FixH
MTDTVTSAKIPRFTGWHMFACLAAFFGTIIAVNVTMAVMAGGSWTGLVVKNSYVASQNFNVELERAKAQAASGLRSDLTFANNRFALTITTADGDTLLPDTVMLSIGRPAFEQQDHVIKASCSASGFCSAPDNLAAGPWMVTVEANVGGKLYRRDARLLVRNDGTASVK